MTESPESDGQDSEPLGPWDIAASSWQGATAALREMPLLFWSGFLALAALELATIGFVKLLPNDYQFLSYDHLSARQTLSFGQTDTLQLFIIMKGSLQAALMAPIAVAVHRFLLIGKPTKGIISFQAPYTRRFTIYLLLVQWMGIPLSFISIGHSVGASLLAAIFAIATIIVSIRLMLIFPAAAISAPAPIWAQSWNQTKGHFWLILFSGFLSCLPLVVGASAVFATLRPVLDTTLFYAIDYAGFGAIGAGLGAAILSCLYIRLSGVVSHAEATQA